MSALPCTGNPEDTHVHRDIQSALLCCTGARQKTPTMSVLLPRLNATPLGHRSLSWCAHRQAPLVQLSTPAVSRQQPSSSRSSSSASTSASPSSSSSGAPGPGDDAPLRWDPCLRLRKQRKMAGNITTIPTTILAFASSSSYFLTQEIDPTNTIAGIDPVYVNVVLTAGCTGELSPHRETVMRR